VPRAAILVALVLLVSLTSSPARSREIWTDANGDGLPDGGAMALAVGDTARLDLWFDSDALNWDGYYLYLGWPRGAFLWTDAGFYEGVDTWLFDVTWYPDTLGLINFIPGGSGVYRAAWIELRREVPELSCVEPLLGVWSRLRAGGEDYPFSKGHASCFEAAPPTATQPTTWGGIKGLYR
jgi:hypothetical protein